MRQALSKLAVQCNNSHWCGLNLAPAEVEVQILYNSLWITFLAICTNILANFVRYLCNIYEIFVQYLWNIFASASAEAYFSIHSGSPSTQFVVLTRVLAKLLTGVDANACLQPTFALISATNQFVVKISSHKCTKQNMGFVISVSLWSCNIKRENFCLDFMISWRPENDGMGKWF